MRLEHFDDPVAAYDRLGPAYAQLSQRREQYLRAVEGLIVERLPHLAASLLDVGAGDGSRTARIASLGNLKRVVMIEPSAALAGQARTFGEIWPVRAEDLQPDSISERFDVITCLWNVLGHIPTPESRLRALRSTARVLASEGRLFLDVNHRYNLRAYGLALTIGRWLQDRISPASANGDVTAKWTFDETSVSTYGHVFTHGEITRLARDAGLDLQERIIVDYSTGKRRWLACCGNLFYVFRRSSRIDSSSPPQTS